MKILKHATSMSPYPFFLQRKRFVKEESGISCSALSSLPHSFFYVREGPPQISVQMVPATVMAMPVSQMWYCLQNKYTKGVLWELRIFPWRWPWITGYRITTPMREICYRQTTDPKQHERNLTSLKVSQCPKDGVNVRPLPDEVRLAKNH